jgi:trehalose-phosphatase
MRLGGLEELLAAVPAGRPLVVALDFDGTLVRIRRHHHSPVLPSALRRLLESLNRAPGIRVAIPTGRALADIERRVGVRSLAYIGNHGLEARDGAWKWTHPDAVRAEPAVRRLAKALAGPVASAPGTALEDKRFTLSLHYRAARRASDVRRLSRRLSGELERHGGRIRVLHGKKVWNIRPGAGFDKGKALLHWMRARRISGTLIFAGDDVTDEEGFRSLGRRALSVRIGPGRTHARFRLEQWEVAKLLRALASRR